MAKKPKWRSPLVRLFSTLKLIAKTNLQSLPPRKKSTKNACTIKFIDTFERRSRITIHYKLLDSVFFLRCRSISSHKNTWIIIQQHNCHWIYANMFKRNQKWLWKRTGFWLEIFLLVVQKQSLLMFTLPHAIFARNFEQFIDHPFCLLRKSETCKVHGNQSNFIGFDLVFGPSFKLYCFCRWIKVLSLASTKQKYTQFIKTRNKCVKLKFAMAKRENNSHTYKAGIKCHLIALFPLLDKMVNLIELGNL